MVASGGLWLGWRGAVMVLEAGGMPWEVASKTRRAGWALVSIGLILVAAALGAVEGFNP